tara:strand:- start:12 stop:704 length:693 start_codon:yes stop_codon:yes gene_type:complete
MNKKERGQTPMIDIGYIPTMCQHCDDAPCMKAAKNGAVTKRNDGIIIIDPEKSKGQKQIVESCPHGSISWNEELEIPQIWFFDAHLLDKGWKVPRAISVCATGAMKALKVEDEEMKQIVEKEDLETLNPEYNTRPRVYYKNLYRYNKCFIGGSVAIIKNKIEDCISGANVKLCKNSQIIDELQTDDFGDFKFDKLPANSGEYEIEIEYKSIKKSIKLNLNDSLFLGNIYI